MNKNQKIALIENDLKIKYLAFKLNLHPGYLTYILNGPYKSPKNRAKICAILEKSEIYLWPEELKQV